MGRAASGGLGSTNTLPMGHWGNVRDSLASITSFASGVHQQQAVKVTGGTSLGSGLGNPSPSVRSVTPSLTPTSVTRVPVSKTSFPYPYPLEQSKLAAQQEQDGAKQTVQGRYQTPTSNSSASISSSRVVLGSGTDS